MSQMNALEKIKGRKYVIASVDANGCFSVAPRPFFHENAPEANAEAARLAKKEPGKAFVALQMAGGALVGGVQSL